MELPRFWRKDPVETRRKDVEKSLQLAKKCAVPCGGVAVCAMRDEITRMRERLDQLKEKGDHDPALVEGAIQGYSLVTARYCVGLADQMRESIHSGAIDLPTTTD